MKQWVCWENNTYTLMAQEHKALIIQLEHRFFGTSNKGLPDLSTANMKFLTPQQAIEDLAFFINGFNKQKGFKTPKWVAFGGSYPGSLAAWLRLVHPEVTVGNVASSASLWPKLDVWAEHVFG
ncbi:serine protease F56F10.1 [Aphelenchoides avenae]|nr:serine protease F56F10.1 [Aphelenchus avenae]